MPKLLTFELVASLTHILKANAPVRTHPLGAIGNPEKGTYSPFPGNLKANGIVADNSYGRVSVGYPAAPYAIYTETRSHKPGWMQRSEKEFLHRILSFYGGKLE